MLVKWKKELYLSTYNNNNKEVHFSAWTYIWQIIFFLLLHFWSLGANGLLLTHHRDDRLSHTSFPGWSIYKTDTDLDRDPSILPLNTADHTPSFAELQKTSTEMTLHTYIMDILYLDHIYRLWGQSCASVRLKNNIWSSQISLFKRKYVNIIFSKKKKSKLDCVYGVQSSMC